jgi:PKD repeat protein
MHVRAFRVSFLFLVPLLFTAGAASSQQVIFGTVGDGNLAVVFPTPGQGLPTPTQTNVTGLPSGAMPHGVSTFNTDLAVVSDFGNSRLFVVKPSAATFVSTISTGSTYNGTGTIAIAPAQDVILAAGSAVSGSVLVSSAAIVRDPRGSPAVTTLSLSGRVVSYQTQGIVFDSQGRAFIAHTNGLSVFDPPYTVATFTVPLANPTPSTPSSGALAISPDGNTLLMTDFFNSSTTSLADGRVRIFKAPYSASDSGTLLTVPGGGGLDGITITPDGQKAIVASAFSARVWVLTAPFTSTSAIEELTLPSPFSRSQSGFEDITVSPDGQLAILTGNSGEDPSSGACDPAHCKLPALFIKAPFTRAAATLYPVTVNGPGRGSGAARFVGCDIPLAPTSVAIEPSGNPTGPVTATDYMKLSWRVIANGTRYEYRINGDSYTSTTSTSVDGVAPRGRTDPIALYVRAYACAPEKGPGAEGKSPDYSMAPPGPSFQASKTTARVGEEVAFTDTSSPHATSWLWFFGNGPQASTSQNPRVTFSSPGVYGVLLLASNGSGSRASSIQNITVTASAFPPPPRRPDLPEDDDLIRERDLSGLRIGPGDRKFLSLTAATDAVVWLQISKDGRLLVERRIFLTAGESPRVEIGAYLPEGFRGRVDTRLVSDVPFTARFEEVTP